MKLFLAALISSSLFMPSLARAEFSPSTWMSASRLEMAIQKDGSQRVAQELYRQRDGWSFVMNKISTGDLGWFSAGSRLRPGLRGAALKDWSKAMSQAMESIPRHVLTAADARSLPLICSPDVDYSPAGGPEVIAHHVNRLMRVVRGVHEPLLQKKKALCLQNLTDDRAELLYMIRQDL